MDNDIKVAAGAVETRREVELFLGEELKPVEHGKILQYNLSSEYAKTRRNHSTFVWIVLGACFVIAGAATFGVTRYVAYANKHISINIDTFDDLNLQNLLDMVDRTEKLYQDAAKKYASLQTSLEFGLRQAKQKRDSDLYTIEALGQLTDQTAVEERKAAVQTEYTRSVRKLHTSYDAAMVTAENEMKQYQARLASFNTSGTSSGVTGVQASQKQLAELELKNQAQKYESVIAGLHSQLEAEERENFEMQRSAVGEVTEKYQARVDALDPVISNERGSQIIGTFTDTGAPGSYKAEHYLPGDRSVPLSADFVTALRNVETQFDDFDYVSSVVSKVPQHYSIPLYVTAMEKLAHSAGAAVTEAAVAETEKFQAVITNLQQQNTTLLAEKTTLQEQISGLETRNSGMETRMTAFEQYLESIIGKDDGLILNDQDQASFPVYLAGRIRSSIPADVPIAASVRSGRRASVKVMIEIRNGAAYAVPVDQGTAEKIRTGDIVQLEPITK
jgi:hypothetical protein